MPRALEGESIAKLSPRDGAPTTPGEPRPIDPPAVANGAPPNVTARPIASTGMPANGAPTNGAPTHGSPQNGGPMHGTPMNGTPTNGTPTNGAAHHGPQERANNCTAPQLRRFIKSRPYVPMHELRRRFGIEGQDDDVTGVRMDVGRIYVGLPEREGALLGELLRGGEIGYELSLDPRTPIVIGVYPMRPVPRA
ncbi:MAG TPA: hypothetical protein VD763_01100 [Candidatus Saccharimonadales bacterium]|nr:hypothetical protein [Candidatus Saccharimonadales bacterium]